MNYRKEYLKKYRAENKEKVRQWFIDNKEKQKEYHREYHKKWYLGNKEKRSLEIKEYGRSHPKENVIRVQRYVQRNKEKVATYNKEFGVSAEGKYRLLKHRHKKRAWADTLMTLEEFSKMSNNTCVYCGSPSKYGIDRVNNSSGYSKENSVPCCEVCNHLKWNLSKHDFLSHIEKIYIHNQVSK